MSHRADWRRMLALIACLVSLGALSAGCGPSSEVAIGVVVFVHNGPAPFQVDSFALRTAGGTVMTFKVGVLEIDRGSFDAPHLRVHELTASPVVVGYRRDGGELVAFRLTDAVATSPS